MTPGKPLSKLAGELRAEFLGTLVLIALGDGVVAMVVLFDKGNAGAVIHGGYTNIALGWGLAVLMGLCVAGRVSGLLGALVYDWLIRPFVPSQAEAGAASG